MRRPRSRCTGGWSAACPATRLRSGTYSTSTTRSTATRCPVSPRSCPRYGCTGTRRQSASAARGPAGARMEFLLLLPHGQRVVLEVDGSHHYASPDGARPDPARYADGRAATGSSSSPGTRYSASAPPSSGPGTARTLLQEFFADLFRRFSVSRPVRSAGGGLPRAEATPGMRRERVIRADSGFRRWGLALRCCCRRTERSG